MGLLSKQDILKADDRKVTEVPVPEWTPPDAAAQGEVWSVLVRGLSGTARDDYFASMADLRAARNGRQQAAPNIRNMTARLIALCVIDPDDPQRERLMFTTDDVAELGAKSGAALARVEEECSRLSGLSDEDMEALGKDSASTPSEGSTSS